MPSSCDISASRARRFLAEVRRAWLESGFVNGSQSRQTTAARAALLCLPRTDPSLDENGVAGKPQVRPLSGNDGIVLGGLARQRLRFEPRLEHGGGFPRPSFSDQKDDRQFGNPRASNHLRRLQALFSLTNQEVDLVFFGLAQDGGSLWGCFSALRELDDFLAAGPIQEGGRGYDSNER